MRSERKCRLELIEMEPRETAGLSLFCDLSCLRLEHRELAPHERVALLLDVEEILGVEIRQFAPRLALPRTTMRT